MADVFSVAGECSVVLALEGVLILNNYVAGAYRALRNMIFQCLTWINQLNALKCASERVAGVIKKGANGQSFAHFFKLVGVLAGRALKGEI